MLARTAPPTHVLLDLDGTISDSSPGITRSLQHAFEACGYTPPSTDAVRTIIGPPFEIGLPRLGIDERDLDRVVAAYRDRYEDEGLFENEVYDGVPELLEALAGEFTLAVATAKPEQTATRIVEHFGFTELFADVVGATTEVGSHRRTKSQVITHALGVLGVATAHRAGPDAVMVGDRDHDVEGARHNGIECIGVAWGFGTLDELHGAGAAHVAHHPADVVVALRTTYGEQRR